MTFDLQVLKDESLQGYPNGKGGGLRFGGVSYRDALLPQWATRAREAKLREYWRHSNNTTFKSIVAGIAKRVVSTPYEVKAGRNTKMYCDNLLRYADLGSWERFVSKLVTDFSRQDIGAIVEIIGTGDPLEPLETRPTGIHVLDPLRCYLTGDPIYPVIYWNSWPKDRDGRTDSYHIIHNSRIRQFPDMPDSDEYGYGTGECALSRCIAPVYQEILMSQYIETMLDDKPQPGYRIFTNVTSIQNNVALEAAIRAQDRDNGGSGRVVDLWSLQPENPVSVEYITHSMAPPGFSYDEYTNLNAKKFAAGLGVDIQEFWELSGGGIGTGTQSEVLAAKSSGKFLGRILKGVERFINEVLPEDAEFQFKYEDTQEDLNRAQIDQIYAGFTPLLANDLTPEERRIFLSNQIEGVKDAISDEDGNITRIVDSDPKPLETITDDATPGTPVPDDEATTTDDILAAKAYGSTRAEFINDFTDIVDSAKEGILPRRAAYVSLRSQLRNRGSDMYIDGLRKGGLETTEIDEDGQTTLATWLAEQSDYLRGFVDTLFDNPDSVDAARKADEWASKSLNQMYYAGLASANGNIRYEWFLGSTMEHCDTCRGMAGSVHRLKDLTRYGILPQSFRLICGGFQCKCYIRQTDKPAQGNLRAVKYVRREHTHSHEHDVISVA